MEGLNLKPSNEPRNVTSLEHLQATISLPGISIVCFMSTSNKQSVQSCLFVDAICSKYPSLDFLRLPRQGSHHSRMVEDYASPTKSSIDEEMSERSSTSTSSRTPSVVARLMGMDAFPIEAKPSTPPKESINPSSRNGEGTMENGSIGPSTQKLQNSVSNKKRSKEFNLRSIGKRSPAIGYGRSSKPKPREHPQEEQLQKFKKEFEAWQLNRPWDCPKSLEFDRNLPQGSEKQKPTGTINKEKMASTTDVSLNNEVTPEFLNDNSTSVAIGKLEFSKEKKVPASDVSLWKEKYQEMKNNDTMDKKTLLPIFHHEGFTDRKCQPYKPPVVTLGTRKKVSGGRLSSITESDDENDGSASPTKIVILKPDFEDIGDIERTWCSSPQIIEREVSMDTFLEEVKEKLRMEIQGKPRHDVSISSGRSGNLSSERLRKHSSSPEMIEWEISMEDFLGEVKDKLRMEVQGQPRNKASTSSLGLGNFSMERPSVPKQIARQIRERVSRDVCTTMMSPESIGTCDCDALSDMSDSPHSINRDRVGIMPESFSSVLGSNGDNAGVAITKDKAALGGADFSRDKSGIESNTASQVGKSHWDDCRVLTGGKASSFREEMSGTTISRDLSPRSLVRSMSAPASGAVVRRLISDEQGALLGDYVPRRKNEKCENDPSDATKKRRDGVNFKGRISSLKHSLALKGKIFSKKSQHAQKYAPPNSDVLHGSTATQSILENNVGFPEENLTEVPPSPASMSSGSLEDFGKPGQPSPISPLEIPFNGYSSPRNIKDVKDIPKILIESPLQTMEEDEANLSDNDEIVDVWDQDEVYIRDVLVRVGLYGKMSAGKEFPRWKMLCEFIPNRTFEEMEEACYDKCEEADGASFLSESPTSRKLLFDLLNEALPHLLDFPSTELEMARFERRLDELHGKKLLHDAWQEILTSTQALDEGAFSLDRVMEQDLSKSRWSSTSYDVKDGIAMDVESMILEQLLDDLALEFRDLL